MIKTKWIIVNSNYEKVGTKTLTHNTGALYIELDPFEKELKEKGLTAYSEETLNQEYLSGLSLKQKIKSLNR